MATRSGLRFGVGTSPYGVAITPDGTTAVVSCFGSNNLFVIDLTTRTVSGAPTPAGNAPYDVAVSPDGATALVTDYVGAGVIEIDLDTRTIIGAPIAVGFDPIGVAITPDRATALVADYGSASVSVLALDYAAILAPPATLPTPVVGSPYLLVPVSVGRPAASFAVTAGALPAGLTLDPSTGAITGTPTAAGAFAFTVTASNSFGTRTAGYSGSVVAPNLAATGSDASPFPALALALVAAGATILLARRRSV